ncbi:MAG: hypothetical protein RR874_20080 [Aeromonas sp.]|uniref:hypothetical protein n=1 Tax=Aeromonas sp. TaxID=647 RepID=UPI002FC89FCA
MSALVELTKTKKRSKQPPTEAQLQAKRDKAAERKRNQRAREKAREHAFVPGQPCSITIKLTADESAYLGKAMKLRALWSTSNYDMQEYLSTLILLDGQKLDKQIAEIPPCKNCGAVFPDNCNRAFYGESDCNLSSLAKGLKLL